MSRPPRGKPASRRRRPAPQIAPGADTLAAAARAVAAVVSDGRSADVALEPAHARPDRSAVRAITLGTLRWYLRLQPAVAPLVARPFGEMQPVLAALLVAGAHQVVYGRAAMQASVHLAVEATRALELDQASGFVNAVLRKFGAQQTELLAGVDSDMAARTAHPVWLVERLRAAWPDDAEAILEANNRHPPMVLRVDESRSSAAEFVAAWRASGREARAIDWLPGAIELERPVPVTALPGFETGLVSVQDAAAQWAAFALQPEPGMRVLDLCAAPGGKTTHLAERGGALAELVAVDSDAARLAMVTEGLARSGRQAKLLVADMRTRPAELAAESFDRILVDAPCSSLGVIRRHPDIKLLRRATDIAPLAATQLAILRTAFGLLKSGGRLLYATCSVLPEENEQVVSAFLAAESGAVAAPWPESAPMPPGALARPVGLQLLPGRGTANCDGFYYACLTRA
jgi:16S rRNA (cytosine967-C5)-methyltransferase